MAEFTIQGKNVNISFDDGTGNKLFVCARAFSIEHVTTMIETTTPTTGRYEDWEGQKISWSMTLSGLLVIDTANFSGFDLLGNQVAMRKLAFEMEFTDDNATVNTLTGTVIVESTSFAGATGDMVTSEITLRGCGAIPEVDSGGGGFDPTSNILDWQYTAVGGETVFTRVDWINADILLVTRDGNSRKQITLGTPAADEVKVDTSIGEIEFGSPLGVGEVVIVIYET